MAFGVLVSKQVHKIEDSGTSTKFQGAKSSQHSHAPKTSHQQKECCMAGSYLQESPPPVGLEPTIFGLEVRRLVHLAKKPVGPFLGCVQYVRPEKL